MPKLIIINGPAGVGKSTAAIEVHKALVQSVMINVDDIRRTISGYATHSEESGLLAFDLANALLCEALEQGRDVIIDRMMYEWPKEDRSKDALNKFIKSGNKFVADVYEFVLWATKDVVRERADKRGYHEGGLLTPEKVDRFWEEVNVFKDKRENALIIDTTHKDKEEVVAEILKYIR